MHSFTPRLAFLAVGLAALAGCARTAGHARARARAPLDAQLRPGDTVGLEAGCDGCAGTPHYRWSLAVLPPISAEVFRASDSEIGDQSVYTLTCSVPAAFVVRLDVSDDNGDGIADYVNVAFAGPVAPAPVLDDAGFAADAGIADGGPSSDGGAIAGALALTSPDRGAPVTDAIPGDLIELHAVPSDSAASCRFDVDGGRFDLLGDAGACDLALYPRDPATYSVQAVFQNGAATGTSTPLALTVHDFQSTLASGNVSAIAVDPLSQEVAMASGGPRSFVYDPSVGGSLSFANHGHTALVASGAGGAFAIGWQGGGFGGYDTRIASAFFASTHLGDLLAVAMVGLPQAGGQWLDIALGTDGTGLVGWADGAGTPAVDATRSYRLVAAAIASSGDPHQSAGFYGVESDHDLSYGDFAATRAWAQSGAALATSAVSTSLPGRITAITSGPPDLGTVWIGTAANGLFGFNQVEPARASSLGQPVASLGSSAPVDALAMEIDGIYGKDVWMIAGGRLQRVSAVDNAVGAPLRVVDLAQPPGSAVRSIGVGLRSGSHLLWVVTDRGLYSLAP